MSDNIYILYYILTSYIIVGNTWYRKPYILILPTLWHLLKKPLLKREYAWDIAYRKFFLTFKQKFPQTKCVIVGSIRRQKEFVHDIDILVVSKEQEIIDWCKTQLENCKGFMYLDGQLSGIDTQIWFCTEENYAPMLIIRTGPQEFSRKLASIAKKKGGTFSESGLFKGTPENRGERLDSNSESNIIWLLLNRKWIHPRDRY